MHILFVADGRSPTTRRYLASLRSLDYRITLVSTFPCAPVEGVEALYVLPVAFGGWAGSQVGSNAANPRAINQGPRRAVARFRSLFLAGRYILGPLTLAGYGRKLARMVRNLKPDLVHAMRIPFEGMLGSYTPQDTPLVVSIWGNDLTLHALGSSMMGSLTRRTLKRANGLIADASRDIRLGHGWGFSADQPALVVPGAGGIDLEELNRIRFNRVDLLTDYVPAGVPLVVNPRGFRPGSVRNDTFFASIPLVLQRNPRVAFVCPAMAGQEEALQAVQKYNLKNRLILLPHLPQSQLWDLFGRSTAVVSVSQHDGTPNSLLEAIACDCFPIAGDIESIREWIVPGRNGLLVEPTRPAALAEAVLNAMDNPEMRKRAAVMNQRLIRERVEVGIVREKIRAFYEKIVPNS
ncbi:MAG: glycosyltransferase [Anaerolineae bacterium]|nr:glycosyltransferase [Anaerolineae bacterium]